jgi:hypothetical protein
MFVSANCAGNAQKTTFLVLLLFSRKAGVSKGEQGESNAEGMGCTQQELQQPCSFQSMQSRFILVFKEKRRIIQFFNV